MTPDLKRFEKSIIPKDVGRRVAEPVAVADIGERRSRIGMAGEILQVDDVAAAFSGGGQGGDTQGMHGDVRIEAAAGGHSP